MATAFEVNLGPENGVHRFRHYDQLLGWIHNERTKWRWIDEKSDPGNAWNRLMGRFGSLENQVRDYQSHGAPFEDCATNISPYFHPDSEGIVLAGSPMGLRINAVRDAFGDHAGAAAYSMARGWISLADLRGAPQIQGAMAYVFPALVGPDVMSRRLETERSNFRSTLRRMIQEGSAAEENRAAVMDRSLSESRRRAVRWARRLASAWSDQRRENQAAHDASIDKIDTVAKAYNELMHLKAPADYWTKKGERHKTAEDKARRRLVWFFPIALVILAAAFGITGAALLRPGADPSTPVYVVVSAGLATFAGVVFWVGRLLTRLYLSEHHLRKDAEEREIMTKTYLALTKDNAADEKDRQIILTALFRNATDGIVKEDAGVDPSLAAAVARIGMGGR